MPVAERASGRRSVVDTQVAPGGLAAGTDPSRWDLNGSHNTSITIGDPGSKVVKDAAAAAGVTLRDDGTYDVATNDDKPRPRSTSFTANLAEQLPETALNVIGLELFEGIEADEQSRQEQIQTYTQNMDMLGLRIEKGGVGGGGEGQTVSNVRHPVLLESIVRFQSAAGAEMLPAAGPAKVENDGDDSEANDQVAEALEKDLNWYLTKIATEYYPETDRANFYLGYGGTIFKKVYKDPVRRRPVSEAVYIPDLIISNDTTDIQNAHRVTHVLHYLPADVKRMQNMKIWRRIDLSPPVSRPTKAQMKEGQIQGINMQQNRQQDIVRTMYECYCTLWLPEHGYSKEKGQDEGLPLPYRVTLDLESRKVLEIRRDWKEGDAMFKRRKHFIKFGLIPGFGFYDLGFLHLIGNQTKALTAIWRILVDAGMFNNFPGGVMVDGVRLTNNMIRPNPGEFVPIKTGPMQDITKAFFPLPYKEPSAVLLQLAEVIGKDAERMGSAVQMETGEGRTNVPVGTIMAQIDQQTQVMQAVHKRLHRAQSEELEALLDLFREDPPMLWKFFGDKPPERQWQTSAEFASVKLRAASDPNVPAQVHRIMLAVALTMLAAQNASLYDQRAVQRRVLTMINLQNPDEVLQSEQALAAAAANPSPDPKVMAAQISAASKAGEASSKAQAQQFEEQSDALNAGSEIRQRALESQDREQDRKSRETVELIKQKTQVLKDRSDDAEKAARLHLDHSVEDHKAAKIHHDMDMDRAGLAADHQQRQHEQHIQQGEHQMQREQQAHQQQIDQHDAATARMKTESDIAQGAEGLDVQREKNQGLASGRGGLQQ